VPTATNIAIGMNNSKKSLICCGRSNDSKWEVDVFELPEKMRMADSLCYRIKVLIYTATLMPVTRKDSDSTFILLDRNIIAFILRVNVRLCYVTMKQ
jgi:hypothetical protein